MSRLVLLALLVAGLGGCAGSAPPVPRDHYYRVLVPSPAAPSETVRFPGVLSVKPLEADGLLRERPLLFSPSGRPHEMQQHHYHYWVDPPPRMLQGQLVDYLRGSGLAEAVITPELRIRPNFEVTGRIKRLERLLGGGPPRVVAELELALVRTAGNELVVIKTYAAEVASADGSVESSILALNAALAEIFARFLADAGWRDLAVQPDG
ncbi:MAG: ABC-type transport auxiliary lipoprotein family protein [Kiloniellaceae bacterium]